MYEKINNDTIFEMLFDKDELTWQTIIYDLVRSEEMDPWDIDVSLLAGRYLETVKKLKEMDFRLSGKILLAAAVMLKIKSTRFVDGDIAELENLIKGPAEDLDEDILFDDDDYYNQGSMVFDATSDEIRLIPRTPQPRKRKVSIYDLVDALQKALEVKYRRDTRYSNEKIHNHKIEKSVDISIVIRDLYSKISNIFKATPGKKLTFSQIIPSDAREDKVYTFIPLIHLTNQRKVNVHQEVHFGDIEITLRKTKEEIDQELSLT